MDRFQAGSGPRVVLLHSGLCTWREWRCVTPQLTAARAVVAPTLPGSYGGPPLELGGGSVLQAMADSVETLLDEIGWTEPVAIAGSSHGAVTALELAARGRASRVVGFAPPWMSAAPMAAYGALFSTDALMLRTTWPIHLITARSPYAAGAALQGSLSRSALSTDDFVATLRSVRDFPFFRLARQAFRRPLLPAFDQIRCPVTLVWGTADRLAPLWMSRRWTQALPDAELVTLPGFPHVPHLRDPDLIAELILEHTTVPA